MNKNEVLIRSIKDSDLMKAGNVRKRATLPRLKSEGLSDLVIKNILKLSNPKNLKSKVSTGLFFVAELPNKKIIGMIGLRKDEGGPVLNRLSSFFVDPKYQGKGIGTLLYNRVLEEALKVGCTKMVLSSSPYAEDIYKHFGFKSVRKDWEEHEDGKKSYNIWMERDFKTF